MTMPVATGRADDGNDDNNGDRNGDGDATACPHPVLSPVSNTCASSRINGSPKLQLLASASKDPHLVVGKRPANVEPMLSLHRLAETADVGAKKD